MGGGGGEEKRRKRRGKGERERERERESVTAKAGNLSNIRLGGIKQNLSSVTQTKVKLSVFHFPPSLPAPVTAYLLACPKSSDVVGVYMQLRLCQTSNSSKLRRRKIDFSYLFIYLFMDSLTRLFIWLQMRKKTLRLPDFPCITRMQTCLMC